MEDPTPLTDPQGYLSLFKFNLKLPQCPRTNMPVSYSDIGDPNGIPVLFVPPSGCTRWFSAPQDPLASGYGLRLITVDRPGCGATPMVPLKDRIAVSCQHIESVLEHLDVKVAHMVATSAGVYCALRLLAAHPNVFLTGLTPPPNVYFISPWSPPLPASDPLAYRQLLDWIPDGLITTQDVTLPYVVPAIKSMEEAFKHAGETYGATTKAVGGAVGGALGAMKSWWGKSHTAAHTPDRAESPQHNGGSDTPKEKEKEGGIPVPQSDAAADAGGEEEKPKRRRLWGPSAKYLTMDYMYAEDFRGVGQEHMLCLNRGGADSGPAWFTRELDAVAGMVQAAQKTNYGWEDIRRIELNVWWGGMDGMVPRNGQQWLNKTLASHPAEIHLAVHHVEDGDHSDLMLRAQGIGEVYTTIMTQGHSTEPLTTVCAHSELTDYGDGDHELDDHGLLEELLGEEGAAEARAMSLEVDEAGRVVSDEEVEGKEAGR